MILPLAHLKVKARTPGERLVPLNPHESAALLAKTHASVSASVVGLEAALTEGHWWVEGLERAEAVLANLRVQQVEVEKLLHTAATTKEGGLLL